MENKKKLAAGAGVLALVGAASLIPITIQTKVSPDGKYRVEWTQRWLVNPPGWKVEAYSVLLPDGAPVKLNKPIGNDDDITLDSFVSSDSRRFCYRDINTALGHADLYSVPIQGGASMRLNQPTAGLVDGPIREVYPVSVRYCGDFEQAGGATTCWATRIDGAGPRYSEVFADGFNAGNSGAWR